VDRGWRDAEIEAVFHGAIVTGLGSKVVHVGLGAAWAAASG
jgi:hypothetical protein